MTHSNIYNNNANLCDWYEQSAKIYGSNEHKPLLIIILHLMSHTTWLTNNK